MLVLTAQVMGEPFLRGNQAILVGVRARHDLPAGFAGFGGGHLAVVVRVEAAEESGGGFLTGGSGIGWYDRHPGSSAGDFLFLAAEFVVAIGIKMLDVGLVHFIAFGL